MTMIDFDSLSTSERILKLQDLWDEIAESPDTVELTAEQKAELDTRLEMASASPQDVIPWQEVRANIRKPNPQ